MAPAHTNLYWRSGKCVLWWNRYTVNFLFICAILQQCKLHIKSTWPLYILSCTEDPASVCWGKNWLCELSSFSFAALLYRKKNITVPMWNGNGKSSFPRDETLHKIQLYCLCVEMFSSFRAIPSPPLANPFSGGLGLIGHRGHQDDSREISV